MVVINCAPHSVTRDAAWIVKNEKQNLLTKLNRTQNFPFKLRKIDTFIYKREKV